MLKAGNVMLTAFFMLNYSVYFSAKFLPSINAIKINPTKNMAIPG